jgi:hypothetical protein
MPAFVVVSIGISIGISIANDGVRLLGCNGTSRSNFFFPENTRDLPFRVILNVRS